MHWGLLFKRRMVPWQQFITANFQKATLIHSRILSFTLTPATPIGPLVRLFTGWFNSNLWPKECSSIAARFEGFMANLSDTIKYTLLTQNHIIRTHAFNCNVFGEPNQSGFKFADFIWWPGKIINYSNRFTKMENQMTYKHIIHKHYNL